MINANIANSQTQYPAPQQDLSQVNPNAQIPNNVQYKAKDVGDWKKLVKWYRIYDPFYDTWDLEEADLGNNRFYIEMKMKHFNRGGEGEALLIFKRRADKLRELRQMGSFEIIEFNETVENQVLHTRRTANGVFELKPVLAIQNYDNPALYFPPPPAPTKKATKPDNKKINNNNKAVKKSKPKTKPKSKSKVKKKSAPKTCDCCDICKNNNSKNTPAPATKDADSWNLNDAKI